MTDDHSFLDDYAGGKTPSSITDYYGNIMNSTHDVLDPSAIITPHQLPAASSSSSVSSSRMSQQTPRRYPPQKRSNQFTSKKSKFQFTKQSRSTMKIPTFMDVTSFRSQERHSMTDSAPAARSFAVDEKEEENKQILFTNEYDKEVEPMNFTNDSSVDMTTNDVRPSSSREFVDMAESQNTAGPDGADYDSAYKNTSSMNPFDGLLRLAVNKTLIMEMMRDEVTKHRVQNAMLLNDLNMVSSDSYSNDGCNMEA
ncbi:hypothetical protein MPSEU_000615500 [Mayamaea pseudoterrestris]|nr:hypothetical protein MPSEU_000615500 [Mayamaea pseudoterrestris]